MDLFALYMLLNGSGGGGANYTAIIEKLNEQFGLELTTDMTTEEIGEEIENKITTMSEEQKEQIANEIKTQLSELTGEDYSDITDLDDIIAEIGNIEVGGDQQILNTLYEFYTGGDE